MNAEQLEKELDLLRMDYEEVISKNASLKERLAEVMIERDELEEEAYSLRNEVESLRNEVESLREEKKELEDDIRRMCY